MLSVKMSLLTDMALFANDRTRNARYRSARYVGYIVTAIVVLILTSISARANVGYLWHLQSSGGDTIASRFLPPQRALRIVLPENSFGNWLRHLPLLPPDSNVYLYDGKLKTRRDVHAAVVDIDVGKRDLQQCADAIMRLRAEFLYALGKPIAFHPQPRQTRVLSWSRGSRASFDKYLIKLFSQAGSMSLQTELKRVTSRAIEPGDILIQGGYPGHAVLILDVAETKEGQRYLLIGQSYMPAQQFHVLKNLEDAPLSPWYDAADLDDQGIHTPEWRPFKRKDLRRF